ncbi:exonuclease domain-containing protein [Zoogloea sp.]|uniref:3'-5' exonuclease n=1 Tax=Zoogloea sp. TaxID=49181 RepID=UPI0035B20ACF
MSPKARQALAVAVASALVVGVMAAAGFAVWRDLSPEEVAVLEPVLNPRLGLLIMIAMVGAGAAAVLMKSFAQAAIAEPALLADEVGLIVGTDPSRRVKAGSSPELQRIAEAVNNLADQRRSLQEDVETRIREARLSVEEERNRLAALMSELNQSVVVCNLDGRILLYNNRARLQFKALSDAPTAAGGGEIIGLGRSIYVVFDRNLIVHALESIQERIRRQSAQPMTNFVTTTRAGQLLRVQMAPVLATGGEPDAEPSVTGFVLMLDNITRNFEAETKRDQMLHTLTEGSRSSLANLRAAAEMLDYPDLDAELKGRFLKVVRDEVEGLSSRLDETANAFADSLKTRWPLDEMHGADLVAAAQRRVEKKLGLPTKLETIDPDVWVKVDSFSLLQAIGYLVSRLSDEFEVREVRFRLSSAGRLAHLDLIWSGQAMSTETVMAWELEPMTFAGESSPLTVRDVVARHDGEIWLQREKTQHRAFFRLLLPSATPQNEVEAATYLKGDSRPEYYDFDLFKQSEASHALDDRLLSELAFTVFDTETTGLNPSEGDEIIQIGATRIVNGKLLKSESFDQLVDPLRELPEASTKIHGITPEMLAGQPPMSKVLPAFHAFAEDTVLVAHNAAFDMRFLQLKEASTGIRFEQPVLDTLLLSAVLHPSQESHRLEAISERMGVSVMGRHTAIGDAIVTGEVFLRMIPLLAEMGIRTLGEARAASEKTYYARVKY